MSTDGPDIKKILDKGFQAVQDLNIKQEDIYKAAPYAIGAACLGSFFKRPIAFSVGLGVVASIAGPQVVESGRQWAISKFEQSKKESRAAKK